MRCQHLGLSLGVISWCWQLLLHWRHQIGMLLSLVLQQLGSACILLVTEFTWVWYRSHTPHRRGESGIHQRSVGGFILHFFSLLPGSRRKVCTRMVLQYVGFSLGAGFVDLVTVLAEEITLGSKNRQVELRHRLWLLFRVPFSQVVDQHPSPFETQHA